MEVSDDRILIFAPTGAPSHVGKDAMLTSEFLARANLTGNVYPDISSLCVALAEGAGVIILTEEALEDENIDQLIIALRSQPPWSDIPVLLFAGAERSEVYVRTLRPFEGLRNVTLLERPVRPAGILSLIRSELRARQRQYEVRDLLKDLADAREEAENASRLKDEFLATLSHELRTPVNAILGWTSMLREEHLQPQHVTRALDTIHRNASAQVQLVDDLLDVSRIVRGQLELSAKIVSLTPIVTLAVESMIPTAEMKGVSLVTSYEEATSLAWVDPHRMQQVLWNLLSNAIKFTSKGGRVEVKVRATGSEIGVSVRDTGDGISAEFLPHVFERFRQEDGSSTRAHGGLGLGLAIARHLVELHGGHLMAESAGRGQGACFTVFLPLRQETARPIAGHPSAGIERRTRPRSIDLEDAQVLIVDDEPEARELLRALLADTGARISEAASAKEALEIVRQEHPDILLADVTLPVEDGYSLMRSIRALPQEDGGSIRSLAVSAYARREDHRRAMAAGFNDHLAKPLQPEDLYAALQRLWMEPERMDVHDTGQSAKIQ